MSKPLLLFLFLFLVMAANANSWDRYTQFGFSSTYHLDWGFSNIFPLDWGSDSTRITNDGKPNGFYTKGRILATRIKLDKPNVSLDLLFPGVIMMGMCFSADHGDHCSKWQHIANLLNGEIGYRVGSSSMSLVNGIHPYLFERWQHDSGLRFSFGNDHEFGVYFFEEDRFQRQDIRFGIQLDYIIYKKNNKTH